MSTITGLATGFILEFSRSYVRLHFYLSAQIEHFAKSIKYGAILGGSEEIMVDFGARQAVKAFPKAAKL
jgi:hypothetical protein